eukprot:jgi/Chlat1/3986/Chrsp26S00296
MTEFRLKGIVRITCVNAAYSALAATAAVQAATAHSRTVDLDAFPPERVRNFGIIAHVDHGKSTLADRLLEMTGTIQRGGPQQYLDKLQVERERGITVKAQTVSLVYRHSDGFDYLLNLIDTPGHVDFSYEVSRSLAACQGALLLVDAAQGIQAQTLANFYLAFENGIKIIPVITKIDQPHSDIPRVAEQLKSVLDVNPTEILTISAKAGLGLEQVLPAVVESIPAPSGRASEPLKLLLFDCYYDDYRGVICLVEVLDGEMLKGERITSAATDQSYEVLDVGILHPELTPTGRLLTGQVGYIITGMRTTREARVGDTLYRLGKPVEPLPGFKPARSTVYAGVYPTSNADYDGLRAAIEKLTCNDASVAVSKESSAALGIGFRCGFLGLLHMDVFFQRLEQEYGASVIGTAPTVPYIVEYADGSQQQLSNAAQLPAAGETSKARIARILEPTVNATVISPSEYVGSLMTLCAEREGEQLEYSYLDSQRVLLRYKFPLREIVTDFYDQLKSRSSGYASFDYEEAGYTPSDVVRLDILLNGELVDAFASVVHRSKAARIGRNLVDKLKDLIDRQMYEVAIQAAVGGKVVARESLSALRKNVLAKCYGGDVTRKRKLLEKQKEGKKRMKRLGHVDVPQEAFLGLLRGHTSK